MFSLFRKEVDESSYLIATYELSSLTNLKNASLNLAIGQSVGNPNIRNKWETDELFENHSCKILGDESMLSEQSSGIVKIAFPVRNTDWVCDGISHLLVQLMGGQLDIDDIIKCRLIDVKFPQSVLKFFKGPKYGLSGIRKFTGVYDKPLLGGIVKPKIGITPEVLLELVKELVEGGVNFIKEDEIMANPEVCPIEKRVPLISNYLKDKNVVYAVCINGDAPHVLERAKRVYELGGNAIHVNFWCGLGIYKSLRDLDLPLFIHFQKSGDKILTDKSHRFSIDWAVICHFAGLSGVDTIHAGMLNGYSTSDEIEMKYVLSVLERHDVVPALSCGMHPGLVDSISKKIGINYMANVGGAIHGHDGGTIAGARAMKQSIDGDLDKPEYKSAIAKWGLFNDADNDSKSNLFNLACKQSTQYSYDIFNSFMFDNNPSIFHKMVSRVMFYNNIKHLPGDIVECGVFKGSGMMLWLKLLMMDSPHDFRKVIGFDFFSEKDCLRNISDATELANMKSVFSRVNLKTHDTFSLSKVSETIHKAGIPKDKFELIPGDISLSSERYSKNNPGLRISLLYMDVDLDEPTYNALCAFWPRIVPGGMIIFDEYAIHVWSESNAVDRFVKENNLTLVKTNVVAPTAYIVKPA